MKRAIPLAGVAAMGLLIPGVAWASGGESWSPTALYASLAALSIGGLAAIAGLWIGRDKSRPIYFAVAMTFLIASAVGVGMAQSYMDAIEMVKKKKDLKNMMSMVSEIAVATGDEELAALIESSGGGEVEIEAPPPAPEPTPAAETDEEG